jgi:UDP-N-acetylglucosamine acyltransferase
MANLKRDEALVRIRVMAETTPQLAVLADFIADSDRGLVR